MEEQGWAEGKEVGVLLLCCAQNVAHGPAASPGSMIEMQKLGAPG